MFFGTIPTVLTTRKYKTRRPTYVIIYGTWLDSNIHYIGTLAAAMKRKIKANKWDGVSSGYNIGTLQTSTGAD